MGIKGLWTVLTPFSEKKSLYEIRGETLAVDLAGWVCDSQNVTDYHIQPKLYLRNLFFRTIYLILADVDPIFVLEGDAPELKRDVMAARNAIQFRGAAPRGDAAANRRPDVGRKRFRNVLKEVADAVVSQDSDSFAYGARRVYRNFSVSSAAGSGAMQGSVDCYDADKMFRSNGFGRNKMVALALLCGSDYGVGACGTSIATVLTFLHTVPDNDIIARLVSWVSDPEHYEEQARWSAAPGRCDRCGHVGRTHAKNGCPVCATHRSCEDTGHKSKVSEVKRELSLRKKALSCGMPFPEPKVMKEFLDEAHEKLDVSIQRPAPSLTQFVRLMTSKLDWSERYSVQKFLPLLTKWHLQDNVPCRTIKPVQIKKKRNPKGVPSYEVQWDDIDGQYEALISDDQFQDGEDRTIAWISTERQDLLRRYYPELVETYEESVKKPAKAKKTRERRKKATGDSEKSQRKHKKVTKSSQVVDLNGVRHTDTTNKTELNSSKISVKVGKLKRKVKQTGKGQKTIHSFIAKKRKSSKEMQSLRKSFQSVSIGNIENAQTDCAADSEHLLSMIKSSNNNHGSDLSDLSDIVDGIVTGAPLVKTARLRRNLVKLVFDKQSTPRKSARSALMESHHCSTPREQSSKLNCNNEVNTSYFFDKLTEDGDAFELSLDCENTNVFDVCDENSDSSLPDVHF